MQKVTNLLPQALRVVQQNKSSGGAGIEPLGSNEPNKIY
jgi:hypothetical protein